MMAAVTGADANPNAQDQAQASPQHSPWFERSLVAPLLSAAAALVAFLPALRNDFVRLDDPGYVTENELVQRGLSWDFVQWAFGSFHFANYHPLTWLSHALDVSLFGLDPAGHHATSVVLHTIASALVAAALSSLTERRTAGLVAGVLFAIHPQHVESVAWISERKDVLSAVFFAAMLWSYSVAHRRRKTALLVLSFALFVIGLLAKPMLVTVPPLLFVIDLLLFRRRFSAQILLEKVPFAVASALFALLTLRAQSTAGAVADWPLLWRISNAIVSLFRYSAQTLWPVDLVPYYRFPPTGWPAGFLGAAVVTVAAITGIVVVGFVRHRARAPLAGWLWFCGMLVPVIGFVKVGLQSMADRYTYLPHVGLFLAGGVALDTLLRKRPENARMVALACLVVVIALVVRTHDQVKVWRDSRTLWTHAIAVEPNNVWAHYFFADIALSEGDVAAALESMRLAVAQSPNTIELLERLGRAEMMAGNDARAEPPLRAIVRSDPTHDVATFLLAEVCRQTGREEEARALFSRAAELAKAKGHDDIAARARLAADGAPVKDLSEPRKRIQ